MKCGTTFGLGSSTACRDWQDAEAVLESISQFACARTKARTEKYALWKRDPYHTSLQFEERRSGICVVRIGEHYRALGLREGDIVAWFWIGTHEEYNRFRF